MHTAQLLVHTTQNSIPTTEFCSCAQFASFQDYFNALLTLAQLDFTTLFNGSLSGHWI